MTYPIDTIRAQFPALHKEHHGHAVCHFDGPAGSQVPSSVAQAVSDYLMNCNSNRCAPFSVSQRSDERVEAGHATLAEFVGADEPVEIVFGQNMTSLTLALSRSLGKTWKPGDEIIVTQLDHDANVAPWMLAAEDAGAKVHHIPVNLEDCTLNQTDYRNLLSEKTRLVALGYASNATGTINPIRQMIADAREVGALTFIDAVHMAPHRRLNVTELDCDFLSCSAYKFYGPHIGILYGKRELLESLTPYKLRPSPDEIPGRWMTGTQSHEAICGAKAAVDYLADLGKSINPNAANRSEQLDAAFSAIENYECELTKYLLSRFDELESLKLWGISDRERLAERVPTFSFTHPSKTPHEFAEQLGQQGIYVWPGNHYAFPFTTAAGLEPGGTLRVGLLHYNTIEEIDRLVDSLHPLLQQ
ncbi:MAG: cysteine desulfurase-like protein [Planctomycetaceae bacterium]|nr:cysteine desulfurase-like protein [Planctomycetaceae bacterium]